MSRLRPVYIRATSSIFGMLPQMLIPCFGSALYRGPGSIIPGGLAGSTLIFFIRMEKPKQGRSSR